jgi:hypothetical protein
MVLESPQLTQNFRDVASYWWGHYFHGLDYSLRIDEEAAPNIHSFPLVIHSVQISDLASWIREHGIRYAAAHHFRKFHLLPDLVGVNTVYAD